MDDGMQARDQVAQDAAEDLELDEEASAAVTGGEDVPASTAKTADKPVTTQNLTNAWPHKVS